MLHVCVIKRDERERERRVETTNSETYISGPPGLSQAVTLLKLVSFVILFVFMFPSAVLQSASQKFEATEAPLVIV